MTLIKRERAKAGSAGSGAKTARTSTMNAPPSAAVGTCMRYERDKMIRIKGSRGVAAVTGFFTLAFSSTQAVAAPATAFRATAAQGSAYSTAIATPVVNAVATISGSV